MVSLKTHKPQLPDKQNQIVSDYLMEAEKNCEFMKEHIYKQRKSNRNWTAIVEELIENIYTETHDRQRTFDNLRLALVGFNDHTK